MGDLVLPPVPIKKEDIRSAVWDSAEVTPPTGSYGERFIGNIDAAISTRSAHTPADVRSEFETVLGLTPARVANLDNLDVPVSSRATPLLFERYWYGTIPTVSAYTPADPGLFCFKCAAWDRTRIELYHPPTDTWRECEYRFTYGMLNSMIVGDGANMRFYNTSGTYGDYVVIMRLR